MKLIVDENIAYSIEAFSQFGNLKLVNGRSISNNDIKDADVLIVRSITRVDEKLLAGSKVQFVGTATIGTDHIDLESLLEHNIKFADAKGCNADSVAEYVFTALLNVASENKITLNDKTIGVVGIGNIGSRVVRIAESLGMRVLRNDPPLERAGVGKNYVRLNEILKADIITFHIPLNNDGTDKSYHLLGYEGLASLEFRRDASGRRCLVGLDRSPWCSAVAALRAGLDFPGAWLASLREGAVRTADKPYRNGIRRVLVSSRRTADTYSLPSGRPGESASPDLTRLCDLRKPLIRRNPFWWSDPAPRVVPMAAFVALMARRVLTLLIHGASRSRLLAQAAGLAERAKSLFVLAAERRDLEQQEAPVFAR